MSPCFARSRVARALWTGGLLALCAVAAQAQITTVTVGKPIVGRYIVTFKSAVADAPQMSQGLMKGREGRMRRTFQHAMKGFVADLSAAEVAALKLNQNVAAIEPDRVVSITATQSGATWGLDRIDQAALPLNGSYGYTTTGAGVRAYIIDTGIRASHAEFGGRVLPGYSAIADSYGTSDCNGHGTHVAGTVGGTTYGVAKGVQLVPVRVLGCDGSGTLSGVLAGVDWVAAQTARPAVANLSLGAGYSSALNSAIANAVAKGVTVVVAAGNSSDNACNYSPASEPSAITVAATTSSDARASYSNYGSCVDIFAPGSSITSAWYSSDSATNTISGTSMASPHTAGVAARVLEAQPDATPQAVANAIIAAATANKVGSAGTGSPNRLLYAQGDSSTPPPSTSVTVAVKGMTGRSLLGRQSWQAEAGVTVRDVASGSAVSGAKVSVSFSTGGSVSCTTGSTGTCAALSAGINNKITSTIANVTGVSGTSMVYDASQNSITSLRIYR